ncbi:hypothetical protein ACFLV2_01260 [Chloroflexota bacterium]
MDANDERIGYVARNTVILRPPKISLSTFGTTNVYYYLITEPSYTDLVPNTGVAETVIREGRVISQQPKIVTPYYMSKLDGFSADARKYFEALIRVHGPDTPGLFYAYKNEPNGMNIVADNWQSIATKLNEDIDRRGDPLASIIKGEDDLWDVSLLKFIYEITRRSMNDNISQLNAKGLLNMDPSGVPVDARLRIEELFSQTATGEIDPRELKNELDRWNVFDEYEDRFFALFKKIK